MGVLKDVYVVELTPAVKNLNVMQTEIYIYSTIRDSTYDDVFTLIEYITEYIGLNLWNDFQSQQFYNDAFEREYVGYRIINPHNSTNHKLD